MSGGYFDYKQWEISNIASTIEQIIRNNKDETLNEWGDKKGRHYNNDVISTKNIKGKNDVPIKYTTLNKIREHNPCIDSWKILLSSLGKIQADDEPLAFSDILNGKKEEGL